MPHLQEVSGAVTKNLFLKDKKKKGLWLVSARHDRQVSSHLTSSIDNSHASLLRPERVASSHNPLCSSTGEPQRPRQEARRRQRQPALRRRGDHGGETQGEKNSVRPTRFIRVIYKYRFYNILY